MNEIRLAGQAITSTNYTAHRLFSFNPEPVREVADTYLACGITEIEIPQGVLDPQNRFAESTGIDTETLQQTLEGLPPETHVIASYLSAFELGKDNAAYVKRQKRTLSLLTEHFPDMRYAMLHPMFMPEKAPEYVSPAFVHGMVDAYAQLAEHARSLRSDFQLCFHNHYDSNAETAEQMIMFLQEIEKVNHPGLRWGPDTGHCHGMGDMFLEVLSQYAHLIGNHFHIKARIPAFDRLHGGDAYCPDRDIWSNKAEIGGGLYSGFVNVADPEIITPLKEIFKIIREKARPEEGAITGAMEIDIPRQHPRLEVLCGTLYLKHVHHIQGAMPLSNDEIIARVFHSENAT